MLQAVPVVTTIAALTPIVLCIVAATRGPSRGLTVLLGLVVFIAVAALLVPFGCAAGQNGALVIHCQSLSGLGEPFATYPVALSSAALMSGITVLLAGRSRRQRRPG
jgi:hypothetical protein